MCTSRPCHCHILSPPHYTFVWHFRFFNRYFHWHFYQSTTRTKSSAADLPFFLLLALPFQVQTGQRGTLVPYCWEGSLWRPWQVYRPRSQTSNLTVEPPGGHPALLGNLFCKVLYWLYGSRCLISLFRVWNLALRYMVQGKYTDNKHTYVVGFRTQKRRCEHGSVSQATWRWRELPGSLSSGVTHCVVLPDRRWSRTLIKLDKHRKGMFVRSRSSCFSCIMDHKYKCELFMDIFIFVW